MTKPLVSITIPTYNSAKSLYFCLETLKNQSYKNIEISIIDGFSKDETVKIAKKFDAQIKKVKGSLLQARYEGVLLAKGKYILLLDSDQILSLDTIERAVEEMEKQKFDMLALEESVYYSNTFVEKLFRLDRQLINKLNDLSPFTGVIMPRFFKTKLLKQAYTNIPKTIVLSDIGGPDHAIVYYEAWLLSKRVGVLKDAVKHIEPINLKQLMRKFYRWGYTSVEAHYGPYHHLMSQKERLRKGLFTKGLYKESVGSIVLLFFKGIAFKIGYYKGIFDRQKITIKR